MAKRQMTMAHWAGFSKKVKHNGELVEVTVPTSVDESYTKLFICDICDRRFEAKKGLTVHKYMCASKSEQSSTSQSSTIGASQITKSTTAERTDLNNGSENDVSPHNSDVEEVGSVTAAAAASAIREKEKSKRRGKDRRRKYTAIMKSNVIDEYENGATQEQLEERYSINRSLVSKWSSEKERMKIKKAATSEYKNHTKIRPSVKYKELYKAMLEVFQKARNRGHHVNFGWLWSKGRAIYREQCNDPSVSIRKHVVVNFLKKNNIRMRAKQRNRQLSKESYREDLMKWHATTRENLIRQGRNDSYDEKWGRFTPEQRFNVDQSPLPFVNTTKRTYEIVKKKDRYHKVWISQPGSGLEKRQCTLQICVRAAGEQPRLAIIFRGKGMRISSDEKASWHKDVDVYFQPNAWADTEFSVKWAKNTLSKSVKDLKRFVLFADNLTAQVSDDFKKSVSDLKGVAWFGYPNATDLWQPVDAGYAQLLKVLINQAFHAWLDDDEHANLWYGQEKGFTAKDRRVLITQWAGDAYKKLLSPTYDSFRSRLFQKTGCLMTSDGSDDDKVSPEGLPDYKIPPPSIVDASVGLPNSNDVEPDDQCDEGGVDNDEEGGEEGEGEVLVEEEDELPEEEEEEEDKESDRSYDDECIGREVRGLYENGWFTGIIIYFNTVLAKYLVEYADSSTALVGIEEFDNVSMILI